MSFFIACSLILGVSVVSALSGDKAPARTSNTTEMITNEMIGKSKRECRQILRRYK